MYPFPAVVPPQPEVINRNRPLPPGCKAYSLLELRQSTGNFSPDALLGEGGFGKVYRGALDDGTSVAIKVLDRKGLQASLRLNCLGLKNHPSSHKQELARHGTAFHTSLVSRGPLYI